MVWTSLVLSICHYDAESMNHGSNNYSIYRTSTSTSADVVFRKKEEGATIMGHIE